MKNNKGFSLVELIVVIAIMAILAAVAVASFSIYIKHAQDASDMDYISNVLYRAKLFSLEEGVEIKEVVISPVVDGAEDIRLIIGWDENGLPIYYQGAEQSEIYETVGNYSMYGEYLSDEVIIKPMTPGEVTDSNPEGGSSGHTHEATILIEHKDSTCVEYGYDRYKCSYDDECNYIETKYATSLGAHSENKVGEKEGYEIHQCTFCGNLVIKSTSGNAIVPLPKEEQ